MSRTFTRAPWANAQGVRVGGGERHISLKPPKWLRKMQPGKIIASAAGSLPVIGGVVTAIGEGIRTTAATAREVATPEGRREAQGLVERAKGFVDELDTTKKILIGVGVLAAVAIVIVMVRRK